MMPKSFHTLIARLGERADPPAHAPARLRFRPGERRPRYAGSPSVARASQHSAYRALYGAGDRHHLRRPRAWHSHKRIFILKLLNKGKDKFLDFVFIEFGPSE